MGQNFDLTALYEDIHQRAGRGERALFKLLPDQRPYLTQSLLNPATRLKSLFVLAHASHPDRELENQLLQVTGELTAEEMVWLLNCYRKHIIQGRLKDGDRLTHDFLERLKAVLFHPDKSVVEWVLRTIDECGSQAIVFRAELVKIKPKFWTLWRSEDRTLIELITYLERKWAPK